MQSIETKFIPATNHKCSRIKAASSGGLSVTLGWEDALNADQNHQRAAKTLILKYGWDHHAWFSGGLKHGGQVFVCAVYCEALALNSEQDDWASKSPRTGDGKKA